MQNNLLNEVYYNYVSFEEIDAKVGKYSWCYVINQKIK